jgi:hypothetical protein
MGMYSIMTSIHIHSQEEGKSDRADYHFAWCSVRGLGEVGKVGIKERVKSMNRLVGIKRI